MWHNTISAIFTAPSLSNFILTTLTPVPDFDWATAFGDTAAPNAAAQKLNNKTETMFFIAKSIYPYL